MGDWKISLMKWLNHQQTGLKDNNKCSKIIDIKPYQVVRDTNNVIRLVLGLKRQGKAQPITKQGPTKVYIVEYKNKHEESRYFTILNIMKVKQKSTLMDGLAWFVCEKSLKINDLNKKKTNGRESRIPFVHTNRKNYNVKKKK